MDLARAIREWMAEMAPLGTATAASRIVPAALFDAVEEGVVRAAVRQRREQFSTGRMLAREALAALGCPRAPIAMGAQGEPEWPPGFVGSISHTNELCVAHVGCAVTLAGIGVDIEFATPLTSDLVDLVCTPGEQRPVHLESTCHVDVPKLCFVAKEAVYKAYFPWTRTFLEFSDLHIDADLAGCRFTGRLTRSEKPGIAGRRRFDGRFERIGDHLVAAVWIPTPAADTCP